MAIGILSILKGVPWGDVILHAPAVAEAARRLWSSVGRKSADRNEQAVAANTPEGRLAELEKHLAELHEQMLASSGLIRELAEQNAQLVRRLEVQRRWIVGLASATGAMALVGVVLLAR